QAWPSLQSAAVSHSTQPGMPTFEHTPLLQVSVVQAWPSLQSPSVSHSTQPGIGVCEQPAAPLQASTVQAWPSSQTAAPPSSTRRSQLLSMASQSSTPSPLFWPSSVALSGASIAFTACTVAVFVKSGVAQAGAASAVISTVRVLPAARVGAFTTSGFVDS